MSLEKFKNKDVYIITDADLDGVGSHIIARLYVEPIVKSFSYTITGDRAMKDFVDEKASKAEVICFVDIAPTLELFCKLKEQGKEILIFDHHLTSYKDLIDVVDENYYFTEEKCGCKIFFDELSKGRRTAKAVFQFTSLVDTYDRWQQMSILWKDAKKLQNILYEYVNWFDKSLTDDNKYNVFIEKQIEKFNKEKNFYFTQYEEGLARNAEEKRKKNLLEARSNLSIRKDDSGNCYGYFECNSKLSDIGNMILNEYEDLNYIIGHATFLEKFKKEVNGKISLRSKGDFDVSVIAQKYGGGGHGSSSGVELPIDIFEKLKSGNLHLI